MSITLSNFNQKISKKVTIAARIAPGAAGGTRRTTQPRPRAVCITPRRTRMRKHGVQRCPGARRQSEAWARRSRRRDTSRSEGRQRSETPASHRCPKIHFPRTAAAPALRPSKSRRTGPAAPHASLHLHYNLLSSLQIIEIFCFS